MRVFQELARERLHPAPGTVWGPTGGVPPWWRSHQTHDAMKADALVSCTARWSFLGSAGICPRPEMCKETEHLGPVIILGIGGWQLAFDPGVQHSDVRADLQKVLLQRRHGGLRPAGASTDFGPERLQEPIRRGHTKEPELMGLKSVTGRPVTLQIPLMILDILFILAPGTVDHLIEGPGPAPPSVGGDGGEIEPPGPAPGRPPAASPGPAGECYNQWHPDSRRQSVRPVELSWSLGHAWCRTDAWERSGTE